MSCFDITAYAADSTANFFDLFPAKDFDYDFTNTLAITAVDDAVAARYDESPPSTASPAFTDETLYTPPSTHSSKLDVINEGVEQLCFDLNTPAASKGNADSLHSRISYLIEPLGNRNSEAWHHRRQNNVSTVSNAQNAMPQLMPVALYPPSSSSLLGSSFSSLPHHQSRHLVPSSTSDLVIGPPQPSLYYFDAAMGNFTTIQMVLNAQQSEQEPEQEIKEAPRKQIEGDGNHITVNPQEVCSQQEYGTSQVTLPVPSIRLSDEVKVEYEEDELDELASDNDEADGGIPPREPTTMSGTTTYDTGLVPHTYRNDDHHFASVMQPPPLHSYYTLPQYQPYQMLANGFTTRWNDHRGEATDRPHNPVPRAMAPSPPRQFYPMTTTKSISPSSSAASDLEMPATKRIRTNEITPERAQDERVDPTAMNLVRAPDGSDGGNLINEKSRRALNACTNCHARKTKCSVHRPICDNCRKKGLVCEYPEFIRRRGKAKKIKIRTRDQQQQGFSSAASPSLSSSVSVSVSPSPFRMPMTLSSQKRTLDNGTTPGSEIGSSTKITSGWTSTYPPPLFS